MYAASQVVDCLLSGEQWKRKTGDGSMRLREREGWDEAANTYCYTLPIGIVQTPISVLQNQILIDNDDENDDDNGDNFDVWWWQCPKIFNYHDFVVKIYPF